MKIYETKFTCMHGIAARKVVNNIYGLSCRETNIKENNYNPLFMTFDNKVQDI